MASNCKQNVRRRVETIPFPLTEETLQTLSHVLASKEGQIEGDVHQLLVETNSMFKIWNSLLTERNALREERDEVKRQSEELQRELQNVAALRLGLQESLRALSKTQVLENMDDSSSIASMTPSRVSLQKRNQKNTRGRIMRESGASKSIKSRTTPRRREPQGKSGKKKPTARTRV